MSSHRRSQRMSQTSWKTNLHKIPNSRAGEGVPLQPLLDSKEEDRDCACAVLDREADQNLVPEQKDETQEGTESCQGDK